MTVFNLLVLAFALAFSAFVVSLIWLRVTMDQRDRALRERDDARAFAERRKEWKFVPQPKPKITAIHADGTIERT